MMHLRGSVMTLMISLKENGRSDSNDKWLTLAVEKERMSSEKKANIKKAQSKHIFSEHLLFANEPFTENICGVFIISIHLIAKFAQRAKKSTRWHLQCASESFTSFTFSINRVHWAAEQWASDSFIETIILLQILRLIELEELSDEWDSPVSFHPARHSICYKRLDTATNLS